MIIGLVLVHLTREEAAPHGVQLVLAQFALQAPLLSVGTAYMVLELGTSEGLLGTALPGAGVADVFMDNFNVLLPVIILS